MKQEWRQAHDLYTKCGHGKRKAKTDSRFSNNGQLKKIIKECGVISFLIAVHVNEGIVLASDRRTTYTDTQEIEGKTIQRVGVHITNSTDKTFLCPNGAGISTCGDASLLGKPITGFIQELIRAKFDKDCHVEDMPRMIIDFFYGLPTVPDTIFLVAGYDSSESGKQQLLYKVSIKDKSIDKVDTTSQGAIWDGETLTLTRLITNVALKRDDTNYIDLPFEDILWGYFTLQDAVDFARYAVETTIHTMHFKNVIETVGGSVDILVITPDGAKWLQRDGD